MFQFPGLASRYIGMTGHDSSRVAPFGNPRINAVFGYPWLIADYYVLHRLLVSRHPPYALGNLPKFFIDHRFRTTYQRFHAGKLPCH